MTTLHDDQLWIETLDGWRWMVKPSVCVSQVGQWWAAIQRTDGGLFHVAMIGNTCDETVHHSSWHSNEANARAWCLNYIERKRNAAAEARVLRPADGFYDDTPWKRLIRLYADGRRQCNCGEAYYNERQYCSGGCEANKLDARDEIATQIAFSSR